MAERANRPLATKKVSAFMSEIRVELAPEFKGETVVLLVMDSDGLDAFRSALARAGQKPSQLTHAGTIHEFAIEDATPKSNCRPDKSIGALHSRNWPRSSRSWMR